MQKAAIENPIEMVELGSSIISQRAEALKQQNIEIYKKLELPKEKEEAWRYTNVERLNLGIFEEQLGNKDNKDNKNSIIIKMPEPSSASTTLITKIPEIFLEKGVVFTDLSTAFEKHHDILQHFFFRNINENKDKFTAMNASFFNNGIFLYVPKNIEVDVPLSALFFYNDSSAIHNVIIVEENSSIDFIEEHYCNDDNEKIKNEILLNEITEVFAEENATVNFNYLNKIKDSAYNFANIVGNAGRNSSINWFSACFGGRINKLRIDTLFNGVGSQSENIGLFLGRGKEHIDITTNVYHNTENTTNNIMFDGILTGSSTSVYRGLIKIEKAAQKTNSYLSNHILKIGNKTLANSIPALKIEANDVKASHGATIGHINDEHLFYLMARGLTKEEAEKMIMQGFLEPIIEKIKFEGIKEKIRGFLVS